MAGIVKKSFFPRQMSLASIVLAFLLVFSFVPLLAFSFFTLGGTVSQLNAIEESAELHFMKDELHHLETRIGHYQQMIDFLSQLPAVMEILNRGESRVGSIDRETAFQRYTGVLNRAFAKNNDVVSIHVLDRNSIVHFSLAKVAGSTTYRQSQKTTLTVDPEAIRKILAMQDKGVILLPLRENHQGKDHPPLHQLLIRILTPIRADGETIGAYVADIDMGVLTQIFPGIRWVLNDGCYLSEKAGNATAFQDFPGLKQIFATKKTAIWNIADQKMAWIPFLPEESSTITLWAGKKVDLASVHTARKKMGIIYLTSLVFEYYRLPFARLCVAQSIWQFLAELLPPLLHAET